MGSKGDNETVRKRKSFRIIIITKGIHMKKMLLTLLISSSCFGHWPTGNYAVYRQTEIVDVKDRENQERIKRLEKENARANARANRQRGGVHIVYNNDNFMYLTNSEKNALKWMVIGALLYIIIRR